jgi:hypothetical protein
MEMYSGHKIVRERVRTSLARAGERATCGGSDEEFRALTGFGFGSGLSWGFLGGLAGFFGSGGEDWYKQKLQLEYSADGMAVAQSLCCQRPQASHENESDAFASRLLWQEQAILGDERGMLRELESGVRRFSVLTLGSGASSSSMSSSSLKGFRIGALSDIRTDFLGPRGVLLSGVGGGGGGSEGDRLRLTGRFEGCALAG